MLPAALSVVFDHQQTRPQIPSIGISFRATEWNEDLSSNAWQDPVTQTLMCRPMCLFNAWYTTNSGIHAKPAIAAYDFLTSGNWEESEWFVGAGKFVRTQTAGEYARTATAPGENRGVVVTFVNYGGGDLGDLCTFGWDDTDVTSSATLYFTLTTAGKLDCYKNGEFVQTLNLKIPSTGEGVVLMLLPMRTRELLVYVDNTGSGGVIVFDDISEGTTPGIITPAEKFWWAPTAAATAAQVQIAPMKFESSAYVTSTKITFSRPPRTGASLRSTVNPVFSSVTNANIYGVKSGVGSDDITAAGVYETDGTTSFVPNGVLSQCRVRVTFSSDGSYTSFFYGLSGDFQGTTGVTDSTDEASADSDIVAFSLEVQDSAFESALHVEFKNPDTLESTVKQLKTVRNRPAKLEVGSLVLWDGWTMPTKYVDSTIDEAKRAMVEIRDMTRIFDIFMFRDEVPFDGYQLSLPATGSNYSMVEYILEEAGFARSQMSLSDASYILPEVPGTTSGEWGFSIRSGDTARSVLEQIHDDFAGDWFMGVRPTLSGPVFAFLAPSDLPASSVITLYRSKADAITGGVASAVADAYVFMTYTDTPEEVDANLIFATGLDPRKTEVVQSYVEDSASIDCTTDADFRPDNWIGVEKPFGVFDQRLRTTDDTDKAVNLLANVVGASRTIGEFTTNTMLWYDSDGMGGMLPVWRGDLVTLDGVGDVRITSMSVVSYTNESGGILKTEARYTFGGFTHAGGNSMAQIQERNNARRARSLVDLRRTAFGINDFLQTRRSSL